MSQLSRAHIELSDIDSEAAWSIVLVGDCVYQQEMASEPLGERLRERIDESDLALVNLEAPIPVDGKPIDKTGPVKESTQSALETLSSSGFEVACLANNHIMDFGPEGLRATQLACADAGIETVGAGENIDEALSPLSVSIDDDGPTLAIVNVCEQEFNIADDEPGTGWISHPTVDQRIEHATEAADIVLVVAHGGIEYVPFPPPGLQQTLRSFVDSGADAIIGHHPHVAQGWEVYNGNPIMYSLGNFLSVQSARPSTSWGLAVTLTGRGSTLTRITPVPINQRDGRVYEMDDPSSHLTYLQRISDITEERDELHAHWQELAVRMFEQRYSNWLKTGTAAGLDQLFQNPRAALGIGTWNATERRTEMLTLLNIVRNESHREVIETALSVRTGDSTDKRTPEIRRTVRELLSWTEDRPVYEQLSLSQRILRLLSGKFR
jgi:hypothetical protein